MKLGDSTSPSSKPGALNGNYTAAAAPVAGNGSSGLQRLPNSPELKLKPPEPQLLDHFQFSLHKTTTNWKENEERRLGFPESGELISSPLNKLTPGLDYTLNDLHDGIFHFNPDPLELKSGEIPKFPAKLQEHGFRNLNLHFNMLLNSVFDI